MKTGKHVIILGAGASHDSGYPLGSGLRFLMQSRGHIQQEMLSRNCATGNFQQFFDARDLDMKLLREGGFGSVDEYCKIVGNSKSGSVDRTKSLIAFCLAINDPEQDFEKSSYYPFVQRLFQPDSTDLRDDVTVLSFNYDPYLEFLIERACRTRRRAAQEKDDVDTDTLNSIHGGLWDSRKGGWDGGSRFRLLKLHGTIVPPQSNQCDIKTLLMDRSLYSRLMKIRDNTEVQKSLFFPWEIPKMAGHSIGKDDQGFPNTQQRMWLMAQVAVKEAQRISFVGLSMHSYLDGGFERLFQNKIRDFELIVCDPSNEHFVANSSIDRLSSANRVLALIDRMNRYRTNRRLEISQLTPRQAPRSPDERQPDPKVTLRMKFADFIDRDMTPIAVDED